MEHEGSLPHSQKPATVVYMYLLNPVYTHSLFLSRSILMLSSRVGLHFQSDLSRSGCVITAQDTCY
jgi:hypothetical protein